MSATTTKAEEYHTTHYSIRIWRAGDLREIHLSGWVPLKDLISDAELAAAKLGWMELPK